MVDIPVFFEAGERMGRVTYHRDGQVAGLFFLPRGLADDESLLTPHAHPGS